MHLARTTNREYRIPLSKRALAVLREALAVADRSGLVFPAARSRPLPEAMISKLVANSDRGGAPRVPVELPGLDGGVFRRAA